MLALTKDNYVVPQPLLEQRQSSLTAGAATWGDGTTGITGTVSPANSLVGSHYRDYVGKDGVAALANGNYVVRSTWLGPPPPWTPGRSPGGMDRRRHRYRFRGQQPGWQPLVPGRRCRDVTGADERQLPGAQFSWGNGASGRRGGGHWGNGTTGITGPVSPPTAWWAARPQTWSVGRAALSNGNYVVL